MSLPGCLGISSNCNDWTSWSIFRNKVSWSARCGNCYNRSSKAFCRSFYCGNCNCLCHIHWWNNLEKINIITYRNYCNVRWGLENVLRQMVAPTVDEIILTETFVKNLKIISMRHITTQRFQIVNGLYYKNFN